MCQLPWAPWGQLWGQGGRTGPWQLVRGGGAAQGEPKGAPSSLQSPAEGSKQEEHG